MSIVCLTEDQKRKLYERIAAMDEEERKGYEETVDIGEEAAREQAKMDGTEDDVLTRDEIGYDLLFGTETDED